jgi:hypothetical protein
VEEDEDGANTVYENGKMKPVETNPGMAGRMKENDGGGEFN